MRDSIEVALQKFIDRNKEKIQGKELILMGSGAISLHGVFDFPERADLDFFLTDPEYVSFETLVSSRSFDFIPYEFTLMPEDFKKDTTLVLDYNGVKVLKLSLEDIILTLVSGYTRLKSKRALADIFESGKLDIGLLAEKLNKANERIYPPIKAKVFKKNFNDFVDDYGLADKVPYMER